MKTTKHILLAAALCLCSAFNAEAAYNGTPVTPKQINSSNYATYGFTAETYLDYVDWYAISTAAELYGFAALVNGGTNSANGVLTADIIVNENVLKADGTLNGTPTHSWTPIGTAAKSFAGKFDGQGHTISGLYFSNTSSGYYPNGGQYIGFFGYAKGNANARAEISNVGIVDSYIKGYFVVAGICGIADSFVTISNCHNAGVIMGTRATIGGICGSVENPSPIITNCYNTGVIKGGHLVGGICGWANSNHNITITNCYNTGSIHGDYKVGGIIGYNGYGSESNFSITIENCYYLDDCAIDNTGAAQNGIGNQTRGKTSTDYGNMSSANPEEMGEMITQLLGGDDTGGVFCAGNLIIVYGDWVVTSNFVVPAGKTLVVGDGASVTITGTGTITNNGAITNNGTFTNNGTVSLTGTITGNDLEGTGNFAYTVLSDSDIETAANGYTYKGTEYTLESGLSDIVKARTICGKQFTFDATGYTVSYENNLNVGNNAKIKWEGNSTIEKTFAITPNTNVVVTITGNSNTVAYNTGEQSISGYTVEIEDETGVYTENDFTFSGTAAASGTTVGTYAMGLSADDFSNTNANFAEVQFVVTDGVLTINKAENAPDMPTTIETYYINTNRVALPDSWQWVENIDLEKGENTATAEYVGDDADNYENVSVEVVVTRTACPHNEGYTTINTAEPTCTEEGYTGDHLCNICNEIFEQGESIEANGHTYSNTVTTPTCTEIGFTTHTCTVCEYTYNSDTIAANGHTEVIDSAVAATCTTPGKTEGKHCSVCEAVLVAQEKVAALGHNFGEYVYNNDATTDADGTETATCSRCSEKDTRSATGTKLEKTPEKGTVVSDVSANAVNIYAHGNTIVVENATEEICVYNAMGALVERVDAVTTTPTNIKVNIPGVFIVKTGRTVKRVIINEQ